MQFNEIPLTPDNQKFLVTIGGLVCTMSLIWRDVAGWTLDVMDSGGNALMTGLPVLTGVDLISQHPDLGIKGRLVVVTDNDAPGETTKNNLGVKSHLIFIEE